MAIELEKKYRITPKQREAITARLKELKAVFHGSDFEENTIFDLQDLTGRPGLLRIRRMNDRTKLTYKRRVPSASELKRQIEFETDVSDYEATRSIVEQLGLAPFVLYEKRRETWHLGDAEIVLDEVPFGLFMEIEGSEASIRDAEARISDTSLQVESRTYPNLTEEFGTRRGSVIEARFEGEESPFAPSLAGARPIDL